jgi:hypothetical protein
MWRSYHSPGGHGHDHDLLLHHHRGLFCPISPKFIQSLGGLTLGAPIDHLTQPAWKTPPMVSKPTYLPFAKNPQYGPVQSQSYSQLRSLPEPSMHLWQRPTRSATPQAFSQSRRVSSDLPSWAAQGLLLAPVEKLVLGVWGLWGARTYKTWSWKTYRRNWKPREFWQAR